MIENYPVATRWDQALHTVVLSVDPFERAISRMIENALKRKRELLDNAGTHFHGFLTLDQARERLRDESEGSFLFHLNEDLPNCLIVSFVPLRANQRAEDEDDHSCDSPSATSLGHSAASHPRAAAEERRLVASKSRCCGCRRSLVHHRVLYKTDLGYTFDRAHQRTILPLLDYCAWKISGNEELRQQFNRHPVSQQPDIVDKLESMRDLFPLWKIGGEVSLTATDGSGAAAFPNMPHIVQRNQAWLVRPVLSKRHHSGDVLVWPDDALSS